jgi:hypothetical protein
MSCPECGLEYEEMPVADAITAIRGFGRRYRAPLTRLLPGEDDNVLRQRPSPDVWSALEYAAHVRDVFGFYEVWVRQILASDRPELNGPEPDEMAREGRYNDQDPGGVAEGVEVRSEALAATLERVPDDGWDRVGIRRGEERSVIFTARRAVHEGSHHLLDIGRTLRAVRSGAGADAAAGEAPAG